MKVSARLQKIFDLADGEELWDIGCDHGLLAVHNAKVQKFKRVVCVDRSPLVIERLRTDLVHRYGLSPSQQEAVSVIESDGCALEWREVKGSVAVAGVGTWTILKILRSVPESLRHTLTWILGPHNSRELLMSQLPQLFPQGARIETHEIKEGSRVRPLIAITPQC